MALPISLDECSKQPQPDHRLVTSLKPPNINENYKIFPSTISTPPVCSNLLCDQIQGICYDIY